MKDKKEKDVVKNWKPLNSADLINMSEGFFHFTGKAINTNVKEVGIRIESNKPRKDLPYIALSTLGASLKDLDYIYGGAAAIPKPRQVKDFITGVSSGINYPDSSIPLSDKEALNENGSLVKNLLVYKADLPSVVPTLLKQVIVQDKNLGDVVLSPLGSLGLTAKIIEALKNEFEIRKSLVDEKEKIKQFWRSAINNLGGDYPQNVGLMGGVKNGRELVSFAWYFPSPKFPEVKIKNTYTTVYRSIDFSLNKKNARQLNWVLNVWQKEEFGLEASYKALLGLLVKFSKDALIAVDKQRSHLNFHIQESYEKSEIKYSEKNALTHLILNEEIPEDRKDLWNFIIRKNDLEKGWLVDELRTSQWAKIAASDLIAKWLNQVGSSFDSTLEKKLSEALAKEIFK